MNDTDEPITEPERPLLRVVRGDPTAAELAALVAVVAARSAAGSDSRPAPRSSWAAPARRVRSPMRPGRGAWGASSLPS